MNDELIAALSRDRLGDRLGGFSGGVVAELVPMSSRTLIAVVADVAANAQVFLDRELRENGADLIR